LQLNNKQFQWLFLVSNAKRYNQKLLDILHQRWMILLKNLSESQLQRGFIHPESQKRIGLVENIGVYAWHSNHHLAHIQAFSRRMNSTGL
jgi:hypothetical protein